MGINYPRGSEWRKRDLHIHTPFSILHNEFGNDFDNYVQQLFKRAIESNIAVIGITDYMCIEGYKKIKEEYLSNDKKLEELFSIDEIKRIKNITLFPNIEFRLTKLVTENRVNFHVIFSDELAIKDIEENFLHELEFAYEGNPYDKDEMKKLKMDNIIALGKKLKEEHSEFQGDSDLFIGMKCSAVDDLQITNTLTSHKSIFEGKYLIFIPSDEDLSTISRDGQGHNMRKILISKSHGLFASNPNTIEWGLGLKHGSQQKFKEEFKTIKPCVRGSDAHNFSKLFDPSEKRFCWIKADPSFEGLQQIIYEPMDRVKIQELKPEDKKDYLVIDKINFIDENFMAEDIVLSESLTVIIGGKSTGKSILLRNIAQTIDQDEVFRRLEEVGITQYPNEVADFNVLWRDGQINNKGSKDNKKSENLKKIVYIPQSYLNRLVDKKEERTSIDDIITNVLKKEDIIRQVFDDLEINKREIERSLTQDIENLFYIMEDGKKLRENVKSLGDKRGIEKEIEKLNIEIAELKKKAGMSDTEIKDYNDALLKINELKKQLKGLDDNIDGLTALSVQNYFIVTEKIEKMLIGLSPDISTQINKYFLMFLNEAENKQREKIEEIITQLKKEKLIMNNELLSLNKTFDPLVEKTQKSLSLKEKISKLMEEEKKLIKITEEEKKIEELGKNYKGLIKKISDDHNLFYQNLFDARTKILKQRSITEDQELEFDIEVVFENISFKENFIENVFDRRKLMQSGRGILQEFVFTNNPEFRDQIEKMIQEILQGKIILRNSYSTKEAITKLTQCRFSLDYKIKQDGDEIAQMSPGKKSFVLLKLLIELDNSNCPILLDQPEDDLDNRSIYNDLVKFIKTKKKERQIIIATHNPNLVVGADAECVIVANQDGNKSKNKYYQFEYVQGSLENSYELIELEENTLYKQGIQEHVCEVLEGGKIAFEKRKNIYSFK